MTTAQIIQFPVNRASASKQPAQRTAGSAQIVIFPGVRQERLTPKHTPPLAPRRRKIKHPSAAN